MAFSLFYCTFANRNNRSHSIADAYRLERLGGSFANFNDYYDKAAQD